VVNIGWPLSPVIGKEPVEVWLTTATVE